MPNWLVLILITTATCGVVLLLALLRGRRAGTHDDPSETPDVIEYMTMMIGVVYAIMLGLAIAGVWEERGAADEWVRREAQALHEISARAGVFPEEVRDRIREQTENYVVHTVEREWPHMADHGELTDRGSELLVRLRTTVTGHEPATTAESYAYQGMLDKLAAVEEARAARGMSAEPTMPTLVWFGLVLCGAVAVGMVFALQIQRSARELLLAGLFSALITFLLYLIWYFDEPLVRGIGEPTEAFTSLFPDAFPGR
ncbi:DUF4239 domain-containing protein [Streptomyces aidingensis]|uniref:DUF4239 domain-containing protein n=1 Tax=Streptomyces aidingensis TaxID=910347 RepID=A0A1I1N1H1_9ACTN|nr:DUF4239 domain-containing protein [Streptomyces aidingensis]SFC91265.1 Protein of unknown function [Streptomyces aidingensis]